MKRNFSIVMIVLCCLLLVPLGAGLFLFPQREFSSNENRLLQKTPEFSVKSLTDGSYTAALEQMCSDQILFRDFWISARSQVLLCAGNQDIGGVYLGEDGFLFEQHTDADVLTTRYEKNLSHVNTFAEKCNVPCSVMLIPGASDLLPELLPAYHQQYDTEEAFALAAASLTNCTVLDLREPLRALGKDAYYRTDHHWTMPAAMQAYRSWCDAAGLQAREPVLSTVSEDFRGTLYSKVLLDSCAYDSIALPPEPQGITCTVNGEEIPMFDMQKLQEKDQYAVLFGGNYGRLDISGGSGKRLLVIKDSYANSFVPFLADDYACITMIDLRYFSGSAAVLAAEYDEILFLYGIANFAEDSNFAKLLL